MHDMLPLLEVSDFPAIERKKISTLQVNLGYTCNQTCLHCHVNAGPNRKEQMESGTRAEVVEMLDLLDVSTLDLTGGAPELNPGFRDLVREARKRDVQVIDRCNLTILSEPGYTDLGEFLARQGVEVVASLPCYTEDNVREQRGDGVFERSIDGLRQLNALGYGQEGSELQLNLVYNPVGPFLPPPQEKLEADYKQQLGEQFGITFNRLFTITNMPIARFGSTLVSRGQFDAYMQTLKNAYQTQNLDGVMCRETLSVDYRGYLYDCDFNQMLKLPLPSAKPLHLRDLRRQHLIGHPIRVGEHCYGCTAGQGSSCGGSLN